MNIWLLNHFAIPPSKPGGSRHYSFARFLQEKGHNVHLFAGTHDHYSGSKLPHPSNRITTTTEEGVPFVWIPTNSGKGYLGRLTTMFGFCRKLLTSPELEEIPRPDVVFGSSPHLFAGLAAEKLAARFRVPFVLEVRDIWPETIIQLGRVSRWNPVVLLFSRLEKRLYRKATHIVSLLPGSEGHIRRINPSAQITIIPNGVDLSRVPEPAPPQERLDFVITYAGAHGLANGLDLILDTANLLRKESGGDRFKFVLIGDGPDKPRLAARCEAEQIANVQLQDPIPKSRIYQELQKADAFFMPLKKAPLFEHGISPNKLFDYMACARPVIFAVSASENPIKASGAGICIPPEDVEAGAAAVRQLANLSPAQRAEIGTKGRKYVLQHHDFRAQTERLESVLRGCSQEF